jgi:hypothetical protein
MSKLKILILSSTPWDISNSFGNTFENIFKGIENIEIANIFCKPGNPNTTIVSRFFQITEKKLIKNLFKKNIPSGTEIHLQQGDNLTNTELSVINYARKNRSFIFFAIRDLIWNIGNWKSKELKSFIDSFAPDIIFLPIYFSSYLNDIAVFLKSYTDKPMVGYVSDDVYTLKQFSLSPFYWINRLYKRKKIKHTIDLCEILYVISDIQKQEYDKCFNKNCKLLWKGAHFITEPLTATKKDVIKLVYTGNLGSNRYKQLAKIGRIIEKINQNGKKAELDIYSLTPLSKKMKSQLNINNAINLMGAINSNEVKTVLQNADILVHVESFDLKNKLAVRHSFSTKIVDYFNVGKCILAIGPTDIASIDYLKKNDAALIAANNLELENILLKAINNQSIITEYEKKSWECGKKNHDLQIIQTKLFADLNEVLKG